MTEKQYPELPTHFMLVQESFRDEVYLYTADQMRAYVDADRAMRAAQAAPHPAENTWAQLDAMRSELATDIREVFDANGPETPQIVRDVIEYADSWLQAYIQRKAESPTQPAAPASQEAEDAARYRYLKEYKTWDSTDVFYWLRCAPADEVDSIIDAARSAQGESNG